MIARYSSKLPPAAILLLTALLFLPSLGGGLVGWDDRIITEDPLRFGLSAGSIFRMFFPEGGFGSSYQPLRTLAYNVIHALAGSNPSAFLTFNLLLYLLNIFLFYMLACLLAGENWRRGPLPAILAALLFAVHPVHVEVVSWHQGGKMTLMGAFFLLSVIGYLRFRAGAGERYYWLCAVSFLLALLSQPAAIVLPLVLVAWEVTLGGKQSHTEGKIAWARLAVLFLPAAVLAFQLLFISTVRLGGGGVTMFEKLLLLPVVWGKSLLKLLLPVNLCARYPLAATSQIAPLAVAGWSVFCAAAGWAVLRLGTNRRAGWFAVLWFVAAILPTSGLVTTSTVMADRYLYLPGMALCLAAGHGLSRITVNTRSRQMTWVVAFVLVLCLASVSLVRQFDWRDRVSLWGRVVEVYPRHSLAQFNLADAWNARGDKLKAIEHYSKAIEIDPEYGDAYANLSTLMLKDGRTALAGQLIAKAVNLRPDRAEVWIKQGMVQAAAGDMQAAAESFLRAIRIDDGWAWAGHFNLGVLLLSQGQYDSAREHLNQALALTDNPKVPRGAADDIRRALAGIPQDRDGGPK